MKRNSRITPIVLAVALALGSCGGGGGSGGSSNPSPAPSPSPTPTPAQSATAQILLSHIQEISGDAYAGRFPGSAGEQLATDYIIAELESYGFGPGIGGNWLQPVPLRGNQPISFSLTIGGNDITRNDAYLYRTTLGSLSWNNRQLVAINSSADIPADMSGQIALVEANSTFSANYQTALSRGAEAVVIFFTDAAAFDDIEFILGRGRFELDDGSAPNFDTIAIVGPNTATALLSALGTTLNGFRNQNGVIGTGSMTSVAEEQVITGNSVVGLLPGTSPSAGAIVLLAHHDHLGTCNRPGSADRICNGAVDNASGVAALLETARQLGEADPLARDIYVFSTTAEEMGLLGARYFIANPPVPLADIHAAINVDTLALNPMGTALGVIGWGVAGLDDELRASAAAAAVTLAPGNETADFLQRQDGWVFLQAGIPSVLPSSGFAPTAQFSSYFDNRYHRANDEVHAGFELGGEAQDIAFYVDLMQRLATPASFPAGARSQGQRALMVEKLPVDKGHYHHHPEF